MNTKLILFSAPMVRAILEGRKTQTRREIKNLHCKIRGTVHGDGPFHAMQATGRVKAQIAEAGAVSVIASSGKRLGVKPKEFDFVCPYCAGETYLENCGNDNSQWHVKPEPGSQLWVKETFTYALDKHDNEVIFYRADGTESDCVGERLNWKPSIFMPRAASRITLEITGVSVERLQDISDVDACDEGADGPQPCFVYPGEVSETGPESFVHGYRLIWESINGKGSWSLNPWVWRIEFRRIRP